MTNAILADQDHNNIIATTIYHILFDWDEPKPTQFVAFMHTIREIERCNNHAFTYFLGEATSDVKSCTCTLHNMLDIWRVFDVLGDCGRLRLL